MHLKRYICLIVPLSVLLIARPASAQFLQGLFGAEDSHIDSEALESPVSGEPTKRNGKPKLQKTDPQKKTMTSQRKTPPIKRSSVPVAPPVPLPIPRPWGTADAPEAEDTTRVAALPTTPDTNSQISPNVPATPHYLLIARPGLPASADLVGRKIAVRPRADGLAKELAQHTKANPIVLDWAESLESLARGEVDAVLVAVGPPMLEKPEPFSDTYRLFEISAADDPSVE